MLLRSMSGKASRVPLFGTAGGCCGTHPRRVDKVLGVLVKRTATAPLGAMDVERVLVWRFRGGRQRQLVAHRSPMVRQLQRRVEDRIEVPKHAEEVGLAAQQ